MTMRYLSLFSGLEAASQAVERLGIDWSPVAFAEVDPAACAFLAHKFPAVPNLGDVSKIDWEPYRAAVDIVVGGSPCQSYSVAGKRLGMADPRGNLALEYLRCVNIIRPRWFLYENVPGLLSADKGEAFGCFLETVAECGYSAAWAILDARDHGVAQRRKRLFVIGHIGDGRAALEAILALSEGESWHHYSGAEAWKKAPTRAGAGAAAGLADPFAFKASHYTRGKDGAPSDAAFPLTADADRGDQDNLVCSQAFRLRSFGDYVADDSASTLKARDYKDATDLVTYGLNSNDADLFAAAETHPCLRVGCIPSAAYALRNGGRDCDQISGRSGIGLTEEVTPCLTAQQTHATLYHRNASCLVTAQDDASCALPRRAEHSNQFVTYAVRTAFTGANGIGVVEDETHTLDAPLHPEAVAYAVIERTRGDGDCKGASLEWKQGESYALTNPGAGGRSSSRMVVYSAAFKAGQGAAAYGIGYAVEESPTLTSVPSGSNTVPTVLIADMRNCTISGESEPTLQRGGESVSLNVVPSALIYDQRGNGDGNTCPTLMRENLHHPTDFAPAVDNGSNGHWIVRRLTPRECFRLQGFDDSWADGVLLKGKPLSDTHLYRLAGNSWAVPVVARLFERIDNYSKEHPL